MTLRRRLAGAIPQLAWRDAALARQQEELLVRRQEVKDAGARSAAHEETISAQAAQIEELTAQEGARSAQLEETRAELDAVQRHAASLVDVDDYLAEPSFRRQLLTLRRTTSELRELDPHYRHPLRQIPFKLRNYRLAASHGIAVPTVYGTWKEPEQIDLDGLPEAFVVKSDGGAASRGVLPLLAQGQGRWRTADGARDYTADEVREQMRDLLTRRKVMRPFFAEEFLVQDEAVPIPDDIKVYACYGEAQQVLVRRVSEHGAGGAHVRRYLRPDGSDLGQVVAGVPVDETIPVPARLPEIIEVAEHLSRAMGVPFVRVDVYDTPGGIVLGEITRAPGGEQRIRADQDQVMGRAWERAVYRLDMDLLAGRPAGVLHGSHEAPSLYHESHVSRSARPGSWAPTVVGCDRWCRPAGRR
ncbi:ATP-grasp fold amidoligase family protein [Serinicoccus kebangsaanensis]|uniref:ATP-grasp fold amidoligase family protein n=1 Tax=Serinicoccus kebangsaanensis TaxID=2602069 RepID=UPI00124EEAE7|nr:ATP-grasp fold amidoligase family protein [Serinicoccus kebangsaanensis]